MTPKQRKNNGYSLVNPYTRTEPELDTMSSRRFSKRQRRKLLTPRSRLVGKKRKDSRTKIGNFVYIAADMHTSWRKIKRMSLYLTDTAFTQHKHDKYSLQTKGQSRRIKRYSKGTCNSKLTCGEFVALLIVLRCLLVKKIGVNQDRSCSLS